ncbi:hypothetical protein FKW77_002027 [Venturia effusa]|uniref:Uncharacterized protein n=1 Tax=Venturia effusa TaxID=50376 RepID=A0A517L0U1_9PEZI|nr:hypothetical protein FKW77_002027 [Venturia effusa]
MVPVWHTGDAPIDFYRTAFPDDKVFQKCKSSVGREAFGKITFVQAVQFLTETSTSYDNGAGPTTSVQEPGTRTTTTDPKSSPTTPAKNIVSSNVETPVSKIATSPAQSPDSQTPQITVGNSVLPVSTATLTAPQSDQTFPVPIPVVVIGTQTVALGDQAGVTIDGTPVAIKTSNGLTFAVVGDGAHASSVQLFPNPSDSTITPPPIIVGGTTIPPSLQTPGPPLVISGQTLAPGSAIILPGDNGAVVALATDSAGNSVLVAGGRTTTLASGTPSAPLSFAGYTFARQPVPLGYVVSGQILTLGGSVTLRDGGSTKALALTTNLLGQTVLVHDGQTTVISSPAPTPMVVDGIILSPISSSSVFEYHVSDRILTMGGTITIGTVPSQTILTLLTNSAGQVILVENGKTTTFNPSSLKLPTGASSTVGIADVIGSVMGLSHTATGTSSSPTLSFSLGSAGPTGKPTTTSSGDGDALFVSMSLVLSVFVAVLGLTI